MEIHRFALLLQTFKETCRIHLIFGPYNQFHLFTNNTYTLFSVILFRTTTNCGSNLTLKWSACRFDAASVNFSRNQPLGFPYGIPVMTITWPKKPKNHIYSMKIEKFTCNSVNKLTVFKWLWHIIAKNISGIIKLNWRMRWWKDGPLINLCDKL